MLIDRRCRLGATVTASAIEVERSDVLLAENAFKRNTTILRVGNVIPHNSIVGFLPGTPSGKRHTPFEQTVGSVCFPKQQPS